MTQHNPLHQNILSLLAQAKKLGADQAEISASVETGYAVTVRLGKVETLEHHQEKNLQITVYQGQRSGSTSTSDLSPDALNAALNKACAIARYTEPDLCAGLADSHLMAKNYPDLHLSHPWQLTPSEAIELAIACEDIARSSDRRIENSEGASVNTFTNEYVYANSHGFIGHFPTTEHSLSCTVIAKQGEEMQRDYEYTLARDAKNLWSIEKVAKSAAEKTLRRLGSRKISTRQAPVIFHSSVAKSLIGNFIAAISGGNLYRRASFLQEHLGKIIFPEFINIYQNPHEIGVIGSCPFDDEGVTTQRVPYVKNGVLQNYVLGSYSARKLGMETTGNAGGVYNLMITHSDKSLKDLLQDMKTGLLVTELIGQGVSIITGDYSRGAAGFWVENGEIQYPVEEITIASNLRDMFRNIQLISNDIDMRGNIKTGSILLDKMTIAGD